MQCLLLWDDDNWRSMFHTWMIYEGLDGGGVLYSLFIENLAYIHLIKILGYSLK